MAFEFTARQPEPANDAATTWPGGPEGTGSSEWKSRLWFTLLALLAFRLGTYVPLPGIDAVALHDVFSREGEGIAGLFDLFSGGAFGRMAMLALGVMPHIAASIIMLVLTAAVPALGKLARTGKAGRGTTNQYARYLTLLFATVQGYGIAVALERSTGPFGPVVPNPGVFFEITAVTTIVGGTMFLVWLGEQITRRGIGDGIPLIMFAGIVANLPVALAQTLELVRTGGLSVSQFLGLFALAVAITGSIVFMERAYRQIVVQIPRRRADGRMSGGRPSHLSLGLNPSGVVPVLFATSLMLLPAAFAGSGGGREPEWTATIATLLGHGQPAHLLIYAALIVAFVFFCTAVAFRPADIADNLQKYGGTIPGLRPGGKTAEFFGYVVVRLTAVAAVYLSAVCLLPEILISQFTVPNRFGGTDLFFFGETSLLFLGGPGLYIVVRVLMDTAAQFRAHILAAYGRDGA